MTIWIADEQKYPYRDGSIFVPVKFVSLKNVCVRVVEILAYPFASLFLNHKVHFVAKVYVSSDVLCAPLYRLLLENIAAMTSSIHHYKKQEQKRGAKNTRFRCETEIRDKSTSIFCLFRFLP